MTVTASGDASLRLIMGKRVQPINTALIPNWKIIDPRVVNGEWFNVGEKCTAHRISGAKPADVQHQDLPNAAG